MVEEKGIVSYAVPFTSGIAFSAVAKNVSASVSGVMFTFAGISFALIMALLYGMFRSRGKRNAGKEKSLKRNGIFLLLFLCGIECHMLSYTGIHDTGRKILESRLISSPGEMLKESVDRLPYSGKETASLAKALLYGDKSGLSRETLDNFRKSGGSHLLALSGMHLGVIYAILAKILRIFGNSRTAILAKAICTVLFSGIYTAVTGASPSLIRAFLFILLNETCRITGRKAAPDEIFHAALMIQLTLAPHMIESLSFQLSYLAVAGITYIYPGMARWFGSGGKNDVMKKIWNASALSISCQITTFPVVWLRFGTFPVFFIMTNLIAIPLTTLAMCSTIAAQVSNCLGLCRGVTVTVNETILNALLTCMKVIGDLSSGFS